MASALGCVTPLANVRPFRTCFGVTKWKNKTALSLPRVVDSVFEL
jgi:hypothetical protein